MKEAVCKSCDGKVIIMRWINYDYPSAAVCTGKDHYNKSNPQIGWVVENNELVESKNA